MAGVGLLFKNLRREMQNFVWKHTYVGDWHSSMQAHPESHLLMIGGQYGGGAAPGQGSTQTVWSQGASVAVL